MPIKKKLILPLMILPIVLLVVGCGLKYRWADPDKSSFISNQYFDASIKPLYKSRGYISFMLRVTNKTDRDIEINWNRTFYLLDGATNGIFSYRGVIPRDRDIPRKNDVILPSSMLQREIFPNALVFWFCYRGCSWENDYMPAGINGILLSVIVDGQEIKEKMSVVITEK